MNKLSTGLRSFLLTCAAAATLAGTAALLPVPAHAEMLAQDVEAGVKVQINDELVSFPDAQPFIDSNYLTQVPVRFVSEELGYKVNWSKSKGNVVVQVTSPEGRKLELQTGNPVAKVDGEKVAMDSAPVLQDGRVYVPLRFISESSGIRIQWDADNYIAILNEDGRYHAPAWYAPKAELIDTFAATAYSAEPVENGSFGAVDYLGNPLKVGTVAVDPSVIPLGTLLYIEGYDFDGLPVGGMIAKATDTGSAIKGKKIDIYIPGTKESLLRFGIQKVKVYKLPQ